MEPVFMISKNSKTEEPHRFKLNLTDKLNLENPNKSMALANLSIALGKISSQNKTTINLKFLLELGIIVLILMQIFKIISNVSSKTTKL